MPLVNLHCSIHHHGAWFAMDDDISPVPRQLELSLKRKWQEDRGETSALPQTFFVLIQQGEVLSVPAIIVVSEVTTFLNNSDVLNSQYLDMIAHGHGAQLSTYIVWHISEVAQFVGGPILLNKEHVKGHAKSLRISRCLTKSGSLYLMQKQIDIRGQTLLLSQFIGQGISLRCFNMADYTWEHVRFGLKELLTPASLAYHAGVRDCDITEAHRGHDENVKSTPHIDSSESDNASDHDECDSDSGDHMHSKSKKGVRYSFETMVHSMRLGILLKNAKHLKKAVAASLQLASSQDQAKQTKHATTFFVHPFPYLYQYFCC